MADIGSVLGDRYRLIELLGQGGMATIYRARDQQLERDPDFGSRFRQAGTRGRVPKAPSGARPLASRQTARERR